MGGSGSGGARIRLPTVVPATFPHPGSATIDHRDPDGPHDSSNWQSAHLACNTSKGRKVAIGADPALRLAVAS